MLQIRSEKIDTTRRNSSVTPLGKRLCNPGRELMPQPAVARLYFATAAPRSVFTEERLGFISPFRVLTPAPLLGGNCRRVSTCTMTI